MNKKDEDEGHSPYLNLEKTRVLQEARAFHDMPLKVRKCMQILTKILHLIGQGETIATKEATETFFAMTKLFQCNDPMLRKMMYLTIKEMATLADDVIIVTSSLTKDMNGKVDLYRASAIRALCKITDRSMLQGIERYMKQAIVDKNPSVQSAALVSSIHLMKENGDVVKRWINEVQQALLGRSAMAQYHALGLLYHIKQKDRLAVSKLVSGQTRNSLKSPYAYCLLIRYATKVITDDPDGTNRAAIEFIESCLRNKSEIVIYEAARALVNLKTLSSREMSPAVSVLQLFLSSPKPTLRFAAVRSLNKLAMTQPELVKVCNLDMENLITDSNRSIATLAITTLLKTGTEASVDRLMKQISSFMSEISDEFKIVVVHAIRTLCLKFTSKQATLMSFLSSVLRDEGGFEYKKAIVDTIIGIVETVPEARETGLMHLCEFIEDCEYPNLLTKVLFMLGEQGVKMSDPRKYIRFIYNRLILENSVVRAAAVTALAKFGSQCEPLRASVVVLLKRCIADGDDEVRDRATLYIQLLEEMTADAPKFIQAGTPLSVVGLERALLSYVEAPTGTFDLKSIPVETTQLTKPMDDEEAALVSMPSKPVANTRDVYAEQLAAVPELAGLGPLYKSSTAADLTEAETEYVVQCVKHVFPEHLVLQFNLTNTLNDQQLEDVKVVLEGEADLGEIISVPVPVLSYDKPATAYVAVQIDPHLGAQSLTANLDFTVKDCDPDTGECDPEGYPDNYPLEDVEIGIGDFMQGVDKPNFAGAWEQLAEACEKEDFFALSSMETLEEAVQKLVEFLGMQPCENSQKVRADKSSHTLYLAGVFVGGHEVLAKAKLALDDGVTLQLAVRSPDEATCELIASAAG